MTEDRELNEFAAQLQAEVMEQSQGLADGEVEGDPGTDFKENVFTQLLVDELGDAGAIDSADICYYALRTGSGHIKVNGYAVDEEDCRVDLFTTVYRHEPAPPSLTATDLRQAFERALRLFHQAGRGVHTSMEPASEAYSMMEMLHRAHTATRRVRVFLLTDSVAPSTEEQQIEDPDLDVRGHIWDIRRLFRLKASGLPYESIEIDVEQLAGAPLPCLRMAADGAADYGAFLAIVPGDLLYRIYDEYGSRLLELNVRSYLQQRGKVNRGIRNTLLQEKSRFFAYNNGLSATAESVELDGDNGRQLAIRRVRGLQIVNGGQTIASIHRARKIDGADLSDVFVQVKLTVVDADRMEDLVPQISRFANTQNKVNEADFSSNHPYHVELERLSRTVWAPGEQSRWFYERARGQYQVAKAKQATTPAQRRRFQQTMPPYQKFTKTDLAKYVNSWDQLPHIVSRGSQKNFVQFMSSIVRRGPEWLPDADYYRQLIGMCVVFKTAERIARTLAFPAYRANAVTYTVAYLAYRTLGQLNLRAIWDEQAVSSATQEALESWMPEVYQAIVESAGERNITEWCKKEDCWHAVQVLDLPVSRELQVELAESQPLPNVGHEARAGRISLSHGDRVNIARVMQLSDTDWLNICRWGQKTGALKEWQSGIASTLSGYAAGGWQKVPSAKQAFQGVRIIELAAGEIKLAPNGAGEA